MSDETARVQAIAQRLKDATPGPWAHTALNHSPVIRVVFDEQRGWDKGEICSPDTYEDCEFIAHAPSDIAFLLEQNARLEAENKKLMAVIDAGRLLGSAMNMLQFGERLEAFRYALQALDVITKQAGRT